MSPIEPVGAAVATYDQWRAEDYYRFYYRDGIVRDERITLDFHLRVLRAQGGRFEHALDYGCGPTLHNAIAVAPYVERLDMADWRPDNLASVAKWAAGRPDASRWHHFTRYILECEGEPTPRALQIAGREKLARRAIARLLPTDARRVHPLGSDHVARYDLLVTGYCIDCISDDQAIWRAAMRNVLALVKPGGTLLLDALWRCRSYQVEDTWFPSANVDVDDLRDCLVENGFERSSLEIEPHAYPEQVACGYPGILVATGRKAARVRPTRTVAGESLQ
jgi:hypothetical protein